MVVKRMLLGLSLIMLLGGMSSAMAGPQIQYWQTEKGARVLFVEAPELPMVDIRVVFDAGSARDGNRPGVTAFANSLLAEGAGDWSAQEIAQRMEQVGAQLETGSLRDMAWVSARTLTRPDALEVTLETLAKLLAEPRFEAADMERLRQQTLAGLLQDEQSPGDVGKKRLYELVFGEHPYAGDPEGSRESVESITREDLQAVHSRFYVANNAVVAIVGAVDRTQAEGIAERLTGPLPAGEAPPPIPPVPGLHHGVVEQIPFPSTQSHLYLDSPVCGAAIPIISRSM